MLGRGTDMAYPLGEQTYLHFPLQKDMSLNLFSEVQESKCEISLESERS